MNQRKPEGFDPFRFPRTVKAADGTVYRVRTTTEELWVQFDDGPARQVDSIVDHGERILLFSKPKGVIHLFPNLMFKNAVDQMNETLPDRFGATDDEGRWSGRFA